MATHDVHPSILNSMADTLLSGNDYYIKSGKTVYVVNEQGIERYNASDHANIIEDDMVAWSFTQSALQVAFTNHT